MINRTGVVSEKNERHSKISNFNSIHYVFPRTAENKKRDSADLLCPFFSLLAWSLNLGIAVSDRTEISRTVRIDVGVVEGGGGGGREETKEKGRERVGLGT